MVIHGFIHKLDGERMTRINEEVHSHQTLPVSSLHQGIWMLLKKPECMVIWEGILSVIDTMESRGDLTFRKMTKMSSVLFYQPGCQKDSYSPSQLFFEIFIFLSMFAYNGQLEEIILGFEMKPWCKQAMWFSQNIYKCYSLHWKIFSEWLLVYWEQ